MKYHFTVPEQKRIRLIVNTDAKNEADDQYAIVQALLTPKFDIRSIMAAQFGTRRTNRSMEESYDEINHLLSMMKLDGQVNVTKGAPHGLPDQNTPVPSEGAELIIREALSDDPLPLWIIFLGPLTDMASALLLRPEIAERANVIWIGGNVWPEGGEEFNLSNDVHAANVVFQSGIQLWQVPRNVYCTIRVSLAELEHRVRPCGELGRYLFEQMVGVNDYYGANKGWPLGESWTLGDSPAVGLLLDEHEYCYEIKPAPVISEDMHYIHGDPDRDTTPNMIRVYHHVDSRFILEDFYSKLALFTGSGSED